MGLRSSFIALAALAAVAACTAVSAQSGTLERVAQSGVIKVGYRESSVPFSYLNGNQPVGFAMDLCARIVEATRAQAKRPDLKVEYQPVTSQNRIPLNLSGEYQMAWPSRSSR